MHLPFLVPKNRVIARNDVTWQSPASFRNVSFQVSARTFEGDCHVGLCPPRNDIFFPPGNFSKTC